MATSFYAPLPAILYYSEPLPKPEYQGDSQRRYLRFFPAAGNREQGIVLYRWVYGDIQQVADKIFPENILEEFARNPKYLLCKPVSLYGIGNYEVSWGRLRFQTESEIDTHRDTFLGRVEEDHLFVEGFRMPMRSLFTPFLK